MKAIKTIILLLVFSFSLTLSAQQPEKKAKKITDKITKALTLNKKDAKAVYEVQLARFKDSNKIKEEFKDEPEIKKEKLKSLGKRVFNDMKKALGKERLKQWNAYKSKNK
jgi:hypothetical protein|tara:strand:- start:6064 stop:6393 length:330 start_codon:yes stop_codon:yes gene_type:complete